MYLKIMNDEPLADADYLKGFRVIECNYVQFIRDNGGDGPAAIVDNETISISGNCYLMNNAGKTIETFAAANKSRTPCTV